MQCRYGIALAGMSLAVLTGEGWQGPLTVMLTLALPPDIKSFAISLWSGITNLIGPTTSTLFGMYLTVTPRLTGILPFTASWLKPFLCTVQVIHCFTFEAPFARFFTICVQSCSLHPHSLWDRQHGMHA
jgi:hypothetical protein